MGAKAHSSFPTITFTVLCLMILFFNIIQNKNVSNYLEFKSNPKKLELPLDKDELIIKPELKIIKNKINLGNLIKGDDIAYVKEQIILIKTFIAIKSQCSKDNWFDCYSSEEINYYELSGKEAFDKVQRNGLKKNDTY